MTERDTIVAHTLRQLKSDHYYASLVLPGDKRAHVQALWAFGAEIAAISERISEPAPGEIRIQWWVDALSGEGHGDVRRNPVADAFLDAIDTYGLQTGPFQRLLAARRFDLYQDPMPDRDTFEGYAGEVNSTLFQYAAIILNQGRPVEPGDAAGHLGVAEALVGHLSAFGFNAARGRIFLPMDIFAANGVSDPQILTGRATEGIRAAIAQFIDLAEGHLREAETAISNLSKPVRPAFAMVAPLKHQLSRLKKQRDPFGPPEMLADWRKIGSMMMWSIFNA